MRGLKILRKHSKAWASCLESEFQICPTMTDPWHMNHDRCPVDWPNQCIYQENSLSVQLSVNPSVNPENRMHSGFNKTLDRWQIVYIDYVCIYVYMYIKVYPVFYLYLSNFSFYMDCKSTALYLGQSPIGWSWLVRFTPGSRHSQGLNVSWVNFRLRPED